MLLKKPMDQWRVKEEIRKYLETNENKNTTFRNLWNSAKAVLRGKFTMIPQETRKISNKQPNLPPKVISKRRNKPQSQPKEGSNKDQKGNK